jgi:hypothetical protein
MKLVDVSLMIFCGSRRKRDLVERK